MNAAFDRHAPALYRYSAVRTGGDAHLAEGLMQQLWASGNGASIVPEDQLESGPAGLPRPGPGPLAVGRHKPPHLPMGDGQLGGELADRLSQDELWCVRTR